MVNDKSIMRFIRGSIYLSTVSVFSMDLIMENKLNFMYVLGSAMLLYLIND